MNEQRPGEMAHLSYPETKDEFNKEVTEAMAHLKDVNPTSVRCMAVCIVEKDPPDTDPNRVRTTHMVIGSKPQMAAMLQSMYSAIGRTFDSEREAKEVPKEKVQ